jgi:hypothetical protein
VGKRWSWVAWSMLAVFVVSVVVGLILAVANGEFQQDAANQVLLLLGFSAFMVVGALVVAHRPDNAIGWIFSAIALLAVTGQLAGQYAVYAYATRAGSLPGAILAGWYGSWPWWLVLTLALVFTPLLFPTGRLLSPRWRPVAWLAGAATAVMTVLTSLRADLDIGAGQVIPNPIGVTAVGNSEESLVGFALIILLVILAAAAFGSLVLRFRRSRGEERQQLKWFTYAGALLPLAMLGDFLPAAVGNLFFAVPVVFLPVATGIAILRYRLYDIDRLINPHPGLWAAHRPAGGRLRRRRPHPWPGVRRRRRESAELGAALFQPARRRIQQAVDRRFNRGKYHAATTIEAYSARLRDQVDLDTLSAELLAVVDQTMEPTRVSLWLRPSAPDSSGTPRGAARSTTWAY